MYFLAHRDRIWEDNVVAETTVAHAIGRERANGGACQDSVGRDSELGGPRNPRASAGARSLGRLFAAKVTRDQRLR